MPNDSNALMPLPRPRSDGGTRATLALIFSLAAFALGVFAVVNQQGAEPRMVVPLQTETIADAALQSRIQAQENVNATLSDEVAKLRSDIDALKAAPAAQPAVNVSAVQARLDEISQMAGALQKKLQDAPAIEARLFTALSTLETIRRRMQDGAGYDDQLATLSLLVPATNTDLAALKNFEATPVADVQLLKDWRRLAADINARDQMANATEITDKIAIQMHKLVTIHPKGEVAAVPPATAGLDKALREQRWDAALKQAESVNAEGITDYAAWLQKLRARAIAEKAWVALREAVMPQPVEPAASSSIPVPTVTTPEE